MKVPVSFSDYTILTKEPGKPQMLKLAPVPVPEPDPVPVVAYPLAGVKNTSPLGKK